MQSIANELGHSELIYQFLAVHRNLNQYSNMRKAATSLNLLLTQDEAVKKDLQSLGPKLILLGYDYNEDIRATMTQIFSSIFTAQEEKALVDTQWEAIYDEMMSALADKNYRR